MTAEEIQDMIHDIRKARHRESERKGLRKSDRSNSKAVRKFLRENKLTLERVGVSTVPTFLAGGSKRLLAA